ncbi:MAG: hypothetical protein BMS9Abin05_2485 [Rhodothermia bacterium]|nr:MAG: hypothetical protein BMS9Abin05_2485 [Rhodothermia bacterium]
MDEPDRIESKKTAPRSIGVPFSNTCQIRRKMTDYKEETSSYFLIVAVSATGIKGNLNHLVAKIGLPAKIPELFVAV